MGWTDIRDGNPVKDKLVSGGTVVGAFAGLPSAETAEACAHAGAEFVIVDAEHAAATWEKQWTMITAVDAAGSVPILRVSNWSRDLISRGLDAGALGIMIPQVESADAARAVVAATRYGPDGTRGVATNRRSGYGLRMSYPEYVAAANAATLVVVMVESAAGVDAVDDIAAVDGIDCIFVGLADLSTDLGVAGGWEDPDVATRTQRVLDACERNGVAFGLPVPTPAVAHEWLERGARMVAVGDVRVFANAMASFISEVRQSFE